MNVTKSLLDDIKTRQLQRYGHVQRMEEGRLPEEVMKWRPPGRRKLGRPKLTWAEEIRGLMGERGINPLNPDLNPICYLLALLRAHHFLHVSRIRVKLLTFRRLMSYIYGAPILDVSRSHTTTQHSR